MARVLIWQGANMVYDCFMFFNELDILEIRLNELHDIVDKFVIVESTRTHTGDIKPLYFKESENHFSQFSDKIIHIVFDNPPEGKQYADHWKRERQQRNAIARGLVNCKPNDIILISDVDEIPSRESIINFKDKVPFEESLTHNILHLIFNNKLTNYLFHRKGLKHFLRKNHPYIHGFKQHPCSVYLNRTEPHIKWCGTKGLYYRDFSVADEARYSGYKVFENGGWHFSYIGGKEMIREKFKTMAHQECNKTEIISNMIEKTELETTIEDIITGKIRILKMDQLPLHIQAKADKYKELLLDEHIISRILSERGLS